MTGGIRVAVFAGVWLAAGPCFADPPLTLSIVPPIHDNLQNYGRDILPIAWDDDSVHVIVRNASRQQQIIPYVTCGNTLLKHLSFDVRYLDAGPPAYGNADPIKIKCGESYDPDAESDGRERITVCARTMLINYPLAPDESIVFDIKKHSCSWQDFVKAQHISPRDQPPSSYKVMLRGNFRVGDHLVISTDWKQYDLILPASNK